MSYLHLPTPNLVSSTDLKFSHSHSTGPHDDHGQIHVSGIFIILIELALTFENLLPILVCVLWLPSQKIGDKQICVFSTLCILSALVPTPLGLVSYFSGGWYGGSATCVIYQVTSLWCSLSSLVMLSYMSVTCRLVVCCLLNLKKHQHPNVGPPSPVTESASRKLLSRSNESIHLHTAQNEQNDPCRTRACPKTVSRPSEVSTSTSNTIQTQLEENTSIYQRFTPGKDTDNTNGPIEPGILLKPNTASSKDNNKEASRVSTDMTENTEGRESSESPPNPATDKSVLHLDVYTRSKVLRNWLRNDVHVRHRFDRPAADTICQTCPSRDYMGLTLVVLFSMTMAISLLPMMGWGPATDLNYTSCEPWIVHRPTQAYEAIFYISYLIFVCMCLTTGCYSGISVCLQVRKRIAEGERRRSPVYYEKNDVNEIWELTVVSDVKKQYRLSCVALAGQLTWIPLVAILVLQIWDVTVSDAVIMYTIVVTSLPGLVNPLLYSLVLSSYRSGYKAILGKRCCFGSKMSRTVVSHTLVPAGMDQNMNISTTHEACLCHTDQSNVNLDDETQFVIMQDSDTSDDMAYDPFYPHVTLSEMTPLQATTAAVASAGTFETTFTKEDDRNKPVGSKKESDSGHSC